jgi:hypothetical protein
MPPWLKQAPCTWNQTVTRALQLQRRTVRLEAVAAHAAHAGLRWRADAAGRGAGMAPYRATAWWLDKRCLSLCICWRPRLQGAARRRQPPPLSKHHARVDGPTPLFPSNGRARCAHLVAACCAEQRPAANGGNGASASAYDAKDGSAGDPQRPSLDLLGANGAPLLHGAGRRRGQMTGKREGTETVGWRPTAVAVRRPSPLRVQPLREESEDAMS